MRKLTSGDRLVVASHNKGKVWEINQLLAPYGLSAISVGELGLTEPAETEATFEGNALIKARFAAEGSHLPALADDSGLEVDALDGAPGVYSADWAGPGKDFAIAMERVHTALDEKGSWKKKKSSPKARFISTLCLAWPDGKHKFFTGKIKGHLVWPPRGGNGFGYDPMFVPKGYDETFGEMEPAEKYAISHRTRAFEKFKKDCLSHLEVCAPPAPNAVRDASGLEAAAANISTKEELTALVANLKAGLAKRKSKGDPVDFAKYLQRAEALLAGSASTQEPKWRSLAKLILAADPESAP